MKQSAERRLRLFLLGVVIYGAMFIYVWLTSTWDERVNSDAIVVLGAAHYNGRPSSVLRARLDHAAELYQQRLAPVVIVDSEYLGNSRPSGVKKILEKYQTTK